MCSVNNFSSKKTSIDCSRERTYNRHRTFSSCLSYASLRYGSALCLIALCFIAFSVLRYGHLRYASLRHPFLHDAYLRYGCLRYGYLRYDSLRYASFRDDHLHNRLAAIRLWINAFMSSTILFKILIIEFCHRYTSIVLS